jgi:hypothetical protein
MAKRASGAKYFAEGVRTDEDWLDVPADVFEPMELPPAVDAVDPHLSARGTDAGPCATESSSPSVGDPPVRGQEKA